jgi:hypothetical protein
MEKSGDCVPFAPFADLPLDFPHSSAVKRIISELPKLSITGLNSRRQLIYRLAHGLTEVTQFLPVHSPVEGFADICAVQPELDVIQFVRHRVLDTCEPEVHRYRVERNVP